MTRGLGADASLWLGASAPRVLLSEEQLAARVRELGRAICDDYAGRCPLLIGVLSGSFVFVADLCRAIHADVQVDFVGVSSYGASTVSSGDVHFTTPLKCDVHGRDVIVVEDIVDTGRTVERIRAYMSSLGAVSVAVAAMLDKPSRREVTVQVDYIGFEVDDLFVVGYGLDFDQRFRNLSYVGVLPSANDG